MFLKKICAENQTHFRFNNLPSENAAVYELTWKKYDTARHATTGNKMLRRKDKIFLPDI
jgi:hypothetical protein